IVLLLIRLALILLLRRLLLVLRFLFLIVLIGARDVLVGLVLLLLLFLAHAVLDLVERCARVGIRIDTTFLGRFRGPLALRLVLLLGLLVLLLRRLSVLLVRAGALRITLFAGAALVLWLSLVGPALGGCVIAYAAVLRIARRLIVGLAAA